MMNNEWMVVILTIDNEWVWFVLGDMDNER